MNVNKCIYLPDDLQKISDDMNHRYYRLCYDGSCFIDNAAGIIAYLEQEDMPAECYTIQVVKMTMREFEALPEFNGF